MIVPLLLVYSHANDHGRDYRQDMLSLLHDFSTLYICTVSKFEYMKIIHGIRALASRFLV